MSTAPVYCINHPKTETLLRCNKCGNPVCIKCVVRTPVGYRCKTCMSIQHAGYYTATLIDYVVVLIVGIIASMIGGTIALALGGWWFISFFYAPAAGGVIAEMIRWALRKRRGRYTGLLAATTVVIGALLVAGAMPLLTLIFAAFGNPRLLSFAASGFLDLLFNIGLWIYLVLATGTVYARLKS